MATSRFGGPLASEFAAFAATLEASATANKTNPDPAAGAGPVHRPAKPARGNHR
jgi:hypothetical protein